mmetsp:Transcript_14490/g.29636  ORF Transcript_14490/g.29636 Transcript_14490/m.29636 type:complete len:579 (-) Transcript_14490:2034-3770(-)
MPGRRSPFAASAYAIARGTNTVEESDLFEYPDESHPTSNIPRAVFQPLDGASVAIITNTSRSDGKNDSAYMNMKHLEEFHGGTVQNFGGHVVELNGSSSITHAIWIATDDDKGNDLSRLSNEALAKLHSCLANSIPIVTPLWLTKIGDLVPGQHWSDVDVEQYKPAIVKLLAQAVDDDTYSGRASTSHQNASYDISESRRDDSARLSASINETFRTLVDENPDVMEEESIRRAMELSMLDFALVHRTERRHKSHINSRKKKKSNVKDKLPHEILGVTADATKEQIKMAYRRRALETHPDKGGKAGEFEAVAHAYRVLLNPNYDVSLSSSFDRSEGQTLKSTSHWDNELKDHRNLVRELYQNHSEDIDANIQRQSFTLERLGLRFKEAGSRIHNEKNELISNACFYISLASSYLGGIGALSVWGDDNFADNPENALLKEADDELIKETALHLKRTIEAAVLSSHPEWAARGIVGEEVQAFSDFLVYILESKTTVSDWAVVVFDKCSGFVDVYKGKNYQDETTADTSMQTSNTLTIQYVPGGHYQPLVSASYDSERPSLKQILSVLDESGVLYVVTDGNA